MLTVLIGIGSALVFGSADFLGGLASKRMSAITATAIAALVGLVTLLIALPFLGGEWSRPAVVLGLLSGVSGAIAIGLLYACLAIGPMSILSPLTAVVSAIVPLTVGLAQGETLKPIGYAAIVIALIAVVLVGFVPEKHAVRPSLRGVLMAIGSGTAIGIFFVIIDQTPDDSGILPLVFNRAANATIMFTLVGILTLLALRRRATAARHDTSTGFVDFALADVTGESHTPAPTGDHAAVAAARPTEFGWRSGIWFAIGCGVIDAIANVGLLLGLRLGELSVMAVLSALYPAGTIILAAIVLRERIAWLQYVGLALAIAAGGMLALN